MVLKWFQYIYSKLSTLTSNPPMLLLLFLCMSAVPQVLAMMHICLLLAMTTSQDHTLGALDSPFSPFHAIWQPPSFPCICQITLFISDHFGHRGPFFFQIAIPDRLACVTLARWSCAQSQTQALHTGLFSEWIQ